MLEHPARRSGPVCGELRVPGDKSISHRALIAGAFASEPLTIVSPNTGRDVAATAAGLSALGASVVRSDGGFEVRGGALRAPSQPIDCDNSGSTARMLLGTCAGAGIAASFDGDASLRLRPMEPLAAQLRAFGARIETNDGMLPASLQPPERIQTRDFILLRPSAQVKTALLFAALFAGSPMTLTGDRDTRDHTERMLRYLGADLESDGRSVRYRPGLLTARPIDVPGDCSAAAFFAAAAAIVPRSDLLLRDVGTNPTRTGFFEALAEMGTLVEFSNPRDLAGEPRADIRVAHRPLRPVSLPAERSVRAIDELPLLAIVAAFARGDSVIAEIAELRTKESDRVAAIERILSAIGIASEIGPHHLIVHGGEPSPPVAPIATLGDHRIEMALGVLGCALPGVAVTPADAAVSFPEFWELLESVQMA